MIDSLRFSIFSEIARPNFVGFVPFLNKASF